MSWNSPVAAMASPYGDSAAKFLVFVLGVLVFWNSLAFGLVPDQSLATLLTARTQEEKNYLRSLRQSLPDYMKEVFETIASEENSGNFVALRRVGPEDSRRLSFNISALPREELMGHAELVIPMRHHRHHCLPHVKTSPEHDPVSPIRGVSEEGRDVVLDATTPLQRRGMRREPLLTFHVQLRSRGHLCHPSVFSDLDLSHAYLLALDAAAYEKLLAHRASLLRPTQEENRRRRALTTQVSLQGVTQEGGGSGFVSSSGASSAGEEEERAGPQSIARKRRQVIPPRPLLRTDSPHCRLVSWRPNVEEIGMDSVIHPPVMELGRCTGVCRPIHFDNVPVTNHTVMKGLYSVKNPSQDVDFCCVPISFRNIRVLVLDSRSNFGVTTFLMENINATSCGCR